jgi:GTP-binding protein
MPRWLVAIVGRPNVGKSTLFNRIIGERRAIVDGMPGVTRDRHYAEAEWAGRQFTLIDTGGYIPDSEDVIEAAVQEQAEVAIQEADVVLFVVDGAAGLLPVDREIASLLRKANKKVILVVNKIDSERKVAQTGEFYLLGLGEPVPVSALMGTRTGDLLDLVTSSMEPTAPSEDEDQRLKIAIVGRPNVGKSSLANALLRQERNIVTDIPGTTRDSVDSVLKYHGEEIVLIDTAGLRRRSKIKESVEFFSAVRTVKSLERCDVVAVMIDAQEGLEHQDLRIISLAMEQRRATVLVVNKWDSIEKDHRTADFLDRALRDKLRQYDFLPIVFISARSRQRVDKVIELAKRVDQEQRKRIPTSQLNTLLASDIATFPPRARSGREIKINYFTQVKVKPPVFTFFCNEPRLIDENYRRYLENRLRAHFSFTGVPLVLTFKKKNPR